MRPKESSPSFVRAFATFLAITLFIAVGATLAVSQTESVVYHFKGGSDGMNPWDTLLADKAGNLYGTTELGGGSLNCGGTLKTVFGCGTVFEITSQNGHLSETVLYAFTNTSDGGRPAGGLAFDQSGNLYGTTVTGGSTGNGTVFQLTPPSSPGGTWTINVLYNLTGFNNGFPMYPLLDKSGNIYFEEPAGGAGVGAVSELSPPATQGGTWTYTQLYSFPSTVVNGSLPIGTLVFDKTGNLYGATANGGANSSCNCGVVFELVRPTTKGGAWTENILYQFQSTPDGHNPYSGVIFDSNGNLFGSTQQGGVNGALYGGYGTVYELSPPAQSGGAWTESVLYSFSNGNDGGGPRSALTRDSQGNLFGTTIAPSAFELSPPAVAGGSWTETTLHNFVADGSIQIYGGLAFRSQGSNALYGATVYGGTNNNGVIYKVVP